MNSDLSDLRPLHRSRLLVIQSLINGYDGSLPFHQYLKNSFARNRQYGSGDRRIYRSWCYAWFRIGKAIPTAPFFKRLTAAYYLVHGFNDGFSADAANVFLGDGLKDFASVSLHQRIALIRKMFPEFNMDDLFPFTEELSHGISRSELAISMLQQPRVFIRVQEHKMKQVMDECEKYEIPFEKVEDLPFALSFEASVKLETLPSREKGYFEIQDRSSQLAGYAIPARSGEWWWDCCCGAGGKSLLLAASLKNIRITATDKRESILENFSLRLKKIPLHKITLSVVDFDLPLPAAFSTQVFDGIVADVPCSGSGTWARTPEKLSFSDTLKVNDYSSRQQAIILKAISCLKPGGRFAYLTCSVFKAENEDMVAWISTIKHIRLVKQALVSGIGFGSDSMFYAIFEYHTAN